MILFAVFASLSLPLPPSPSLAHSVESAVPCIATAPGGNFFFDLVVVVVAAGTATAAAELSSPNRESLGEKKCLLCESL